MLPEECEVKAKPRKQSRTTGSSLIIIILLLLPAERFLIIFSMLNVVATTVNVVGI